MVIAHLSRIVIAGFAAIGALLFSGWLGASIQSHRRAHGNGAIGPRFVPGEPALIDLGFDQV